MKIKEIMIRDVISLKPDDRGQEALDLLFKSKISGLPVIDEGGKLLGMFTEKSVLSYILPSYVEKVGRFIYQDNPKAISRKLTELKVVKVSQLMRREVITTSEEASLTEAARLMLTQKVRRLLVVDKEKKVLGIVARCDILKAIPKEAEMSSTS
ncbi:MAG: hypothetical protein DRP74_00900 [Candidatus Omnitrophota bacterium]|nr:MAG: hypothetical protein DRP74_00900 [Candidatus Omnitrophota bacterium]